MPKISPNTSIHSICTELRIPKDAKGAKGAKDPKDDTREIRYQQNKDGSGKAWIKTGPSIITRVKSREAEQLGARRLLLEGLRASLRELSPRDAKRAVDDAGLTAITDRIVKALKLPKEDGARTVSVMHLHQSRNYVEILAGLTKDGEATLDEALDALDTVTTPTLETARAALARRREDASVRLHPSPQAPVATPIVRVHETPLNAALRAVIEKTLPHYKESPAQLDALIDKAAKLKKADPALSPHVAVSRVVDAARKGADGLTDRQRVLTAYDNRLPG